MAERKKSVQTLLDSAGDGKQAQRLARAEDLAPLEFQAAQTRKLQRIVSKLADRLEAESGELPVTSLAINIGIISDKLRELGGPVPSVTNQTNIQINGLKRSDLVSLLSGQRIGKPTNASRCDDVTLKGTFAKVVPAIISRQRQAPPAPIDLDVSSLSVNAESTVSP